MSRGTGFPEEDLLRAKPSPCSKVPQSAVIEAKRRPIITNPDGSFTPCPAQLSNESATAMTAFVSAFTATRSPLSQGNCSCATNLKMQASDIATDRKLTLYSMPVSNYAARCRYLIRRKDVGEDLVAVRPPKDLGGLKADDYLTLNPLGKMPVAVIHSGTSDNCLFESSVICEYLAESFSTHSPSFVPETPEARAKARLIANLLDIYVGPYHPFMYKKLDGNRTEGVAKMRNGFDAIEHTLDEKGPYATGKGLSIADCCLWGNWPFYDFMLPTFFGWHPTDERPKLKAWAHNMAVESQAARDVYAEVFTALQKWWDNGRWTDLSMTALSPRPELPF